MLRAGASVADKRIAQLIAMDAKEFSMGGAKVEIAQVNAVDVDDVLSRQTELEAALHNVITEKGLDLFLFVVTDILNATRSAWPSDHARRRSESAYGVTLENNRAHLKGVVSRKSQIVPVLTETFSER